MQKKSKAHEGLTLLAHRDGVPPAIVMDGSKEQTMGEFPLAWEFTSSRQNWTLHGRMRQVVSVRPSVAQVAKVKKKARLGMESLLGLGRLYPFPYSN